MDNFNISTLTSEQQRSINMYVNQYNQTKLHIEQLTDMLDEISGNIVNVLNSNQPRRNRSDNRHSRNTNTNTNINRLIDHLFNDRQNTYVHYDYNEPINPNIYNANSRNRNRNRYSEPRRTNRISQNNSLTTLLSNFFNSTVAIRPTEEQIQNASRIVRYGDIENPLSETCPISLEPFEENSNVRQIMHCGHIFSQQQFQEWFSHNVRCPVCRYDIRNTNTNTNTNTNANTNTNTTEEPSQVNVEQLTNLFQSSLNRSSNTNPEVITEIIEYFTYI
jgi:hypothetical protein